jgi:lipid II:glycine glycyltransferase (peptidoglycan interpeptide bridge formation enzyme)
MEFSILSHNESEVWSGLLQKIPDTRKSPHFTPEFYKLFELRGEGQAICFAGVEGEKVILYPCLLNSINSLGYDLDKQYFDIQGAYGYNGPITNYQGEEFLNEFSNQLLDYYKQINLIAEFIRFCPILKNHLYLNYLDPIYEFNNVLIDLSMGYERIWLESFNKGVRKSIRKAIKNNLHFEIYRGREINDQSLDIFSDIYLHTMDKNNADNYYLFPNEFYKELVTSLPDNLLLCFAKFGNESVSTEILLFNSNIAYGFLGGTLTEYYNFSPNSFLRNEIIKYLINRGIRKYSIGGGTRDDSVYIYKRSFSQNSDSKFFIAKKIHNNKIYDEVINQWKLKHPEKITKFKNFLLKYRYIS